MRRKLLDILQRPIPGTSSLGRNLLRLLRRLAIGLLKFLRWFIPLAIALIALWMIGGNLLAAQQEKTVDQALEQFRQQFPNVEANYSALKLEELTAGLGFGNFVGQKSTPTRYLHSAPKANRKDFEDIKGELNKYLDAQLDKPNDAIDPPPEKLRRYLMDHATELEAVRTHVLNSDLPRWEVDMNFLGDIAYQALIEHRQGTTEDLSKRISRSYGDVADALDVLVGTGVVVQAEDELYEIGSRLFEEWVIQQQPQT